MDGAGRNVCRGESGFEGRVGSSGAERMSLRAMGHSRGRSAEVYIFSARARVCGWEENEWWSTGDAGRGNLDVCRD